MDSLETGPTPQPAHWLARVLAKATRKLRLALADMWERQAWRGQFDRWAQYRETDSVLEAFGLERGQIPLFIKGIPAAGRQLRRMIARTGARLGLAAPPRQELLRVCALCGNQQRCQEWLDSGATTGFEEFCPNAAVFAAAKRR